MKKYRVYLDKVTSGTVEVEAETMNQAEHLALHRLPVDWSDEPITHVCDVVELDEEGEEMPESE